MNKMRAPRIAKKSVRFRLSAPEAKSVMVTGSFCDWETHSHHMKRDKSGTWATSLPGTYEYRFLVDGEWRDDTTCRERVPNAFGSENCILHVLREATQAARAMAAAGQPL